VQPLRRACGWAEDSTPTTAPESWSNGGSLDARLRSFRAGTVDLELSIKDRETRGQRTTLEAWIVGLPRVVATSDEQNLGAALSEVRDELIRQLTDAKDRTEPGNNRNRRSTEP
jgi:ribosome-associated translation inhibitor RaiA